MQFFILILYILQICNAEKKEVKEIIDGITTLNNQIPTWSFPENSNSYKGPTYDPNVIIYDGDYDFIIGGAGTSGALIAHRLSQILSWRILVIEAGDAETKITRIPKMSKALKTTKYNWGYFTVPQKIGFKSYMGNQMPVTAGKGVGGSSILDWMLYVRGNKEDYNKWGKSNKGWTYDEVLPFFKKSENALFPNADLLYHGDSGELNVNYSRVFNEFGQTFLDSYIEMGRKNLDYNAQSQMGASRLQLIQENGKRDSSASAFLNPANSNVDIFTNSLITKLLINTNKEVYGVQYLRDGVLHYATVSKEVILCLGAVNSAQALMLSGIGPKDHLEEKNIPVIQDLKVGYNLWDHLQYKFNIFKINITQEQLDLEEQVTEYLQGSGPLTAPYALQAVGFTNVLGSIPSIPDVEYLFHSSIESEDTYQVFKNLEGYTEETYNNVVLPTLGVSQWSLDIISLHPESRGTVRLNSNNPFDYPVIDPNYFSASNDIKPFIKAIYDTIAISQTQAFQKYNSQLIKVCHSACDCSKWGTEAFFKCMVLNLSSSLYEFSGTAKMGPATDSAAVVDNNLQVYGIKKLRVADASVIPDTISGNTNAAVFMIGEKASATILAKYMN